MRRFLFIILILSTTFLSGCSLDTVDNVNLPISTKKPNNYFYTFNLSKALTSNKDLNIYALDTNLTKQKTLSKEYQADFSKFISYLKTENFVDAPENLPRVPKYKLFVNCGQDKKNSYVINVYNYSYVSVYPWDGTFSCDYVNINSVPTHYNPYGLCEYLFK
jgi:hypothetical protein